MIDDTERLLNLINGFNNIVRYNAANNIPPSKELLVAQDYINNKIDSSDIFNPYLIVFMILTAYFIIYLGISN